MSRTVQNFASTMSSLQDMTENLLNNGRVDLMSALPTFNIPNYQIKTPNNTSYSREAITGQYSANKLSDIYFSPENIDALQEGIRYRVYVETQGKYVIGRQSDQELKIVMRSIYFQFGLNNDNDCIGQVRTLNAKVLDWVVPEVLSNLLQYARYKVDASTLPMPLDRAPIMTTKGTKVLEIKSFM
jgi:hypothetical protein